MMTTQNCDRHKQEGDPGIGKVSRSAPATTQQSNQGVVDNILT